MKKYTTKLLVLISMSTLLFSCAGFNPNIVGNQNATTQISINSANFKVIEFTQGSASANYFLGIGGLNKKGLVASSKAKMYETANLKGSQIIINEHTEWKSSMLIPYVWGSTTVTTSGLVIEFTK